MRSARRWQRIWWMASCLAFSPGLGFGRQRDSTLVELVRASGQSWRAPGGGDESALATGCGGSSGQSRGADDALFDLDARQNRKGEILDRQYPSGFESCEASCAAVQKDRRLGHVAGLYQRQNLAGIEPPTTTFDRPSAWVTAFFRLKSVFVARP
jgi:hypothetical protein